MLLLFLFCCLFCTPDHTTMLLFFSCCCLYLLNCLYRIVCCPLHITPQFQSLIVPVSWGNASNNFVPLAGEKIREINDFMGDCFWGKI